MLCCLVLVCTSEMDHELLDSSLLYHGTYLLDELRREQQVCIDDDLARWFQNHLHHTSAPRLVVISN